MHNDASSYSEVAVWVGAGEADPTYLHECGGKYEGNECYGWIDGLGWNGVVIDYYSKGARMGWD
jgi:hypothetical protein